MRLLLPMAYTIAFVMKSAICTDSKPSDTNDNYTYRLLELDVEPPPSPERQVHKTRQPYNVRPSNNDYADNSYQQSIIPRRTHSSYPKHNDGDDDNGEAVKPAVTKPIYKKAKIVNVQIPDDFQREISQLRIPRRVTKKRKKSKPSVKKPRQEVNMGTDMDLDMDINMEDIDMDVNVGGEPEIILGEEESARDGGSEDEDNDNNNSGSGGSSSSSSSSNNNNNNDDDDGDGNNENDGNEKKYKKGGKRYKIRKGKGKGKGKGKKKSRANGNGKSRGTGKERGSDSGSDSGNNNNDDNNNNNNNGADDDESNHQEEEEEVEEKKEKVHKVTIKKKRPYVNGTKPMATSPSASASGAKPSTPISHSHSYSRHPHQYQLGGKKPGSAKPNSQTGGGAGAKRLPEQSHQQIQLPSGQQQHQQHQQQVAKLVKPLMLQENAAVEVLNANHQENGIGSVRKGIKPRDVNLILRTKNSPRILIRRYKPLFGAYPVGLNLIGRGGQRKIVYRRLHNTRKKACKKCKKIQNKHKYSTNQYPASAYGDVEMVHTAGDPANVNAAAVPTSCAHTTPPSPFSSLHSAPFSGSKYPWYGDGNSGNSIGTPSSYFPNNKFEYVDENVISPRLPSQPVNAYIRMPLPMPQSSPSPAPYGSGRSSDGGEGDDDDTGANDNGDVVYQSLPSDANTNSAIAAAGTRQQQNQIQDNKTRRQQPQQQQQRSGEEKQPAYQVHETEYDEPATTEYEPVTGHANVEELAAVHQLETDASLFPEEQHERNSRLQPFVADTENVHDHDVVALAMAEEANEADELDEWQQEDEQEPVEKGKRKGQKQQDGGVRGGDDEEEEDEEEAQAEAEAEGSMVEGGEEDEQEPDQQYVDEENEKPKSDNIFDISNVDTWMEDMMENETEP